MARTPRKSLEMEVREHISDIMFDPASEPDPDCDLCLEATRIGLWQEWGSDDPVREGPPWPWLT